MFSCVLLASLVLCFFQAEDGIRDLVRSRGLGDVYKRQDRILDKGIVVDAWVRVSLVGIEILALEARAVVALSLIHI